ncbi:MAG: glycosyltransferase family 39 protein [Candidatus Curtissbacteria bacterium]|nr:glycosyltransferase family 39 protein [Candidatus Curtissbacteria bacterium]
MITISLAIFLRTYNYQARIHLQADNSQDVQIARFAADNFKLPLAGPFSSAGPFYYGPWYFWFLEIISFMPLGFLTHWYALTFVGFLFIVLVFWLGREVGGKWVGAISALFAAISPAQIANSLTVWNPAVVPILSLMLLIFLVRFYKRRKIFDLFLLGFFAGLSITIHFQSLLTVPTVIAAMILIKPSFGNYLKYIPFAVLGFLIPFVPLIWLDSKLYWYNFTSLFIFLAIDQFNAWIPNRWLTYAFSYWPKAWADIIGGSRWISIFIIFVVFVSSLLALSKIKKNINYFLIAFTFLAEVILYRYYRGQRFEYYSFFAHGPIFILSGWGIFQLYQFKKVLGVFLFILIFIFTINVSIGNFNKNSLTLERLNTIKEDIYSKYPEQSFNIYGCMANANSISHPMALLMYWDGRDSLHGLKIGVCEGSEISWEPIISTMSGNKIIWYERSTERVYYDTAEWWLKSPPKKGGSLREFLKKNLSPGCWPHC